MRSKSPCAVNLFTCSSFHVPYLNRYLMYTIGSINDYLNGWFSGRAHDFASFRYFPTPQRISRSLHTFNCVFRAKNPLNSSLLEIVKANRWKKKVSSLNDRRVEASAILFLSVRLIFESLLKQRFFTEHVVTFMIMTFCKRGRRKSLFHIDTFSMFFAVVEHVWNGAR